MPESVSYAREGRIAVITVDNPPVNALSHHVRLGLSTELQRALAEREVAAIVILCAGRTFVAGADIREFGKPMQPPFFNKLVDEFEAATKPVVAAIHGTALGGGLELALACHYRVAVPGARLGLPEVKLGLPPGAGGTQRLPRLIGIDAALPLIAEGKELAAKAALTQGILDELIEGDLRAGAIAFAERIVAESRPIRRTGSLTARLDNPGLFDEYTKTVKKRQRGFEAPLKIIEAVRMAVDVPFAEATQREYDMCMALMQSSQSKAQRHLFAAEREVVKVAGLPADTPTRDVRAAAVVGPGAMGTGIAICFANAGIPVTLLGRSQASIDKAMAGIAKSYAGLVSRGSLKQEQMDQRLALIKSTTKYEDLRNADLVVEAVAEDLAVKQDVFRQLDAHCRPGAILATNTSYIDVDALAQTTRRPADVVGTHFLIPANVMRLLENVRGKATAPDVLATVMAVARKLGKLPVLVGNGDGFVLNRMLAKRSREGFFMLEEGATPWQIDKVLYEFGFPMGPYSLSDLAGIDVAWANRKSRLERLTPRERACNILEKIANLKRYGQKTGAGYYRYDEKRNATPDPEIEQLIVQHSAERGITRRTFTDQEILERCLFAMINEGAVLLEEGIASRPEDIDVIWVHGCGFPAYRGGPMFHADQLGLDRVLAGILRFRDQVGAEYFTPAPLLERLARQAKGFYGG
jgi:3-hydroxyacyl-CoA dehydrogenase